MAVWIFARRTQPARTMRGHMDATGGLQLGESKLSKGFGLGITVMF